jgi:uncharacterized membrane protein YgcG
MRWLAGALCVLLLCLAAAPAGAADPAFPDRGRRAVVDAAGVIPDAAEAALDARISAWNRATGHQLAVATIPDLQGHEIQDYANRLLRQWGLGRAGIDDGVLLLLAPRERQVRIEVGYGLEGVLTDARSHRIIAETIQPALERGDIAGALTAGADRIMTVTMPPDEKPTPPPFPLGFFLFLALLVFGPVFWWWWARRRRRLAPPPRERTRDERRYATVPRAENRPKSEQWSAPADTDSPAGPDALAALRERAARDSSSGDDYGGDYGSSGFDSGGGSGGGGGASDNY